MAERILITGANRGIGLALTTEFLKQGDTVIATARVPETASDLHALRSAHPDRLRLIALDVTSGASVMGAARAIGLEFPALDVLINNAGLFAEEGSDTVFGIDVRFFRDDFDTNVVGPVRVTRAFLPLLERGERPRIVNISSGAGVISQKEDARYPAYAASKAALNMVSRTMAFELKGQGVTVVALTPGWVKTRMGGPQAEISPEESAKDIAATVKKLTIEKTALLMDREGQVLPAW